MRRFSILTAVVTPGEGARALAYGLVALCSAVLGYLAVLHLDGPLPDEWLSLYQIWIVTGSAIGGVCALFLSGDRMGQSGRDGVRRAFAGAIWITFIGALIGGTLGLPLWGTMFGPFIVVVTLLGAPKLAMFWALALCGVHFLLGIHQRERDTIFAPRRAR